MPWRSKRDRRKELWLVTPVTIGIVAGLVGLVMVSQATVRMASAAASVTAQNRLDAIRCHRRLSPKDIQTARDRGDKSNCLEPSTLKSLRVAIQSQRNALRIWPGDYRGWRDLAMMLDLTARHDETPKNKRAELLRESRDAAVRSVKLNPGQPFTWTRIAQTELVLNRKSPAAVAAFRMSFISGPQVVDLMQARVAVGLILWPELDAPLQKRVLAQIRGLARYNIHMLTNTVLVNYQGLPQVRRALRGEEALMEEFRDLYNQRRRPGYRSPNTVPRKVRKPNVTDG